MYFKEFQNWKWEFLKVGKIGIKQIFKQRVSLRRISVTMRNTYDGNKNTGIPSIQIPLNIARRNYYLDSRCTLTLMIPEIT